MGDMLEIVGVVQSIMPHIMDSGIKVISNAGKVNPNACKNKILKYAKDNGYHGLKVAIVDRDDILNDIDKLIQLGHPLKNMEKLEISLAIKDQLLSANVYFGLKAVVEALEQGADIIITGRVTDTGLTLIPMIYEFGLP